MPVNPDGSLRPFNAAEIAAMQIETTKVRDGSHPTETREIGQSTMRRTFFCKWEERFNFCAHLAGDEVCFGPANLLSRMLPDPTVGRHPNRPQIVCTKIESVSGHGRCLGEDANRMPMYAKARVDAFYEHVPYDLLVDGALSLPVGSEQERYVWFGGSQAGGDSITAPGGIMRFRRDPGLPNPLEVPEGVPVPYSVNVIRPTETFHMLWTRVPFEGFEPGSALHNRIYGNVVTSFIGMANSVTFLSRKAGTVQFMGLAAKLERSHTGSGQTWELNYEFLYTPETHLKLRYFQAGAAFNDWYYVGSQAFRTPLTLPDYESIVPGTRDLNLLFQTN